MSGNARHVVILTLIVVCGAFLALLAYWRFDPSVTFFPRCPFNSLTGLDCPGCGSQRALHALLNGDVAGAFRFNFILPLIIPWVVVMLLAELLRSRYPRFNRFMTGTPMVVVLSAVIALWWIARNLLGL